MRKILYIIIVLMGVASNGYAQGADPGTTPEPDKVKVRIFGNVYGGGELAQVIEPNKDSIKSHIIQDADLATLFDKKHTYTTYVHLGEYSEVYGRVFGGGKGLEDSEDGDGNVIESTAGSVTGQTDVALDGATVWSELYGGGEMADVNGNTLLHFKKGKAGHNAFGGGLGKLTSKADDDGNVYPDNRQEVLASADIKKIAGITDKVTGESFVVFDGSEKTGYTHYEFEKARTFDIVDGKPVVTETDQFNPERPEQLFSINHNIYGGGMTASKVEGKTFVHVNYGMVNDEMMNFKHNGQKVWSMIYKSIANAQFCVFGGGYGYHTDIYGDANVTMDVQGDVQGDEKYKYINEFTDWFAGEGKRKYGWDTNVGDPELIYKAADESTWSHGAPGRSCMDIVGGGYNGKVHGTANVTVGGDVVVRKVYGGGYYASVGNTNINLKSGIFERVYGGGMIGNVYGTATLNFGQQGTSKAIADDNLHLLVKDAIYGGNDVSGTVGTTAPGSKTQTTGDVTYNVFDPVDDAAHGVRLNIYGGLVLGDVFGAGNGNHPGYTNPDGVQFHLSQHPSENYRRLQNEGKNGSALVYKYRPRTGRVVMNIAGNAGTNFNDIPTVDKVRIWGRTFGGGNSCNVGIWDGTADDNTEVYSEGNDAWHPGDNFLGDGTIQINIGSHVQLGNRNDSHETPNGLFMGNNGQHMVTQTTDPSQLINYHHYWNPRSNSYLPGFLVYDASGKDIGRKAGLKSFAAFINNILTWTNNVNLNIDNDVQDVWMSNFVGGGYRGSMKAKTAEGAFAYTLPSGVTIGHSVVGGAFNAHIVYRIYEPDGAGYRQDTNGNYVFQTIIPTGWKTDIQAKEEGEEYGNYLSQYSDGTILRYNFDGGIMGHESSSIAVANGARCNQVRNGAFDFTSPTKYDKSKALVYLNLRNKLDPIVTEAQGDEPAKVHGGIVYGGCFHSGYIDGDVWVDYRCSLSPLCKGKDDRFFNKTKAELYTHVDNLEVHNALNVFGAGYGTDTHTMGDTYLRILHNGTSGDSYDYPYVYNVFGGGNMGTVAGNTNVFYNVGNLGTVVGSLYGGGYKGTIDGNTYVELAGGLLLNAYGGSREANIGGAAHVWAYDGAKRPDGEDEASPESAPLLVGNIYGGNDISGSINGAMPAVWTEKKWTDLEGKTFNSYVQVGGTEGTDNGYPLVGNIFAGGNGEKTAAGVPAPDIAKTLLEIDGGTTLRAFGGGNKATVTDDAYILVDAAEDVFTNYTFTDYQRMVLMQTVFKGVLNGYHWDDNTLVMDPYHVVKMYGGNNVATMAIQPKWNLKDGMIENVYSGGNMGDMTYYNESGIAATTDGQLTTTTIGIENNADGTNANYTPRGLSITINSPDINIKNLFGGCRLSNVVPGGYAIDPETKKQVLAKRSAFDACENLFGATINILNGNIENVFGGNDVGGKVYYGTNINISGGILGNVYGSGNGDYLYQFDAEATDVTEQLNDEFGFYYKVPEKMEGELIETAGAVGSNTHKILTINRIRPAVDKTFINIGGLDAAHNNGTKRVAAVKGNIFMGGNATTITRDGTYTFGKFKLGSYTTINGLFLGSDGLSYTDNSFIEKFAKLNGIENMGAETSFNVGHELDKQHNPILLNTYLMAVDVQSPPKDFSIQGTGLTEAYIGTFCGGGNRGSMLHDKTVEMDFPKDLVIFDKIVAGCMDATVNYNQHGTFIRSIGGYTRALVDNGTNGNTKMKYTINSKFKPLVMDAEFDSKTDLNKHGDNLATAMGKGFVYDNLNTAGDAYGTGCNIYGGCYQSGEIMGDVDLNVTSDMLEYCDDTKLQKSIANGETCFNIFGAGFGQDSHVWGNVHIKMDGTSPSANNIFGGGRNGQLIGNTTIELRNGHIYSDVAGGCFASDMYGSSQIIVGYPTYYKCNTSGKYELQRGDQWNTEQAVSSVKYLKGELVPANVYDQITDGNKSTNFTLVNDEAPTSWSNVNIRIGKGVYGGGYSLANSTSASAGAVTTHKLIGTAVGDALYPMNFNGRYGIDDIASTVGYGGNSAIMVGDVAGAGTGDHIQISSLNEGGIYGDGHLTFCEGFRAADITGYGYNTASPSNPRLLNTFQRLDLLDVNDCCLKLEGAQDFAANQIDATVYSATRIDELRMNSTIDANGKLTALSNTDGTAATGFSTPKVRNYVGFNNNVHYLGAIVTNDDFDNAPYHDAEGNKGSKSYKVQKAGYINAYASSAKDASATEVFKARNLGTARNCIGINNGYCLRVQNLGNDGNTYYGPVVGVAEVKLLTLKQGEGGGYVYADNIHADQNNFLNTSGNFVFPGAVSQGKDGNGDDIADQYIVDDCFLDKFGTPNAITTKDGPLDEAHYWYVEGNKYFYNTTLTGYTFQDATTFNLIENDPNVILSGMEEGSMLDVKKIEWLSTHRTDYECVLENATPNKTDDYQFDIEVGAKDDSKWSNDMPRYTAGDNDSYYTHVKPAADKTLGEITLPQFNIKLQDKLDNSGDANYNNHLDEPEKVKIYLVGTASNGNKYEYTITLNIVYLQGPTYEGGVDILNCALPGERIGFSSGGIKIKTPNLMPITASSWQVLPLEEISSDGTWKWNSDKGVVIPSSQYSENTQGGVQGWIPALYKQNEYNIAYIFTAGGHNFPVLPDQTKALKQNRMIVVHNYHRMKDVVSQNLQVESMPVVPNNSTGIHPAYAEAKLYIEDEADLRAFVNYLNMATDGNVYNIPVGLANLDIFLQKDIILSQKLSAVNVPFAGNFHGDGYHIDLNGKCSSLFGSLLSGHVYNLGIIGGSISTVDTKASNGIVNGAHTTNSYEAFDNYDFKYGRIAYALSHHFLPDNPGSDYVSKYYSDGDYQYATTDLVWSLRTGEPWYGHTETRHNCDHTHDAARWQDGRNIPLYSGTKVVPDVEIKDNLGNITGYKLGLPAGYANDYLFFGQHLDKESADAYPTHIYPVAKGDLLQSTKGGNRVYETAGYYQSKDNLGFYYNKDAWALQPTLTAIDFENMTVEADDAQSVLATFNVNSSVTQNLLVYNAGESLYADGTYADKTPESAIKYHSIVDGSIGYLHLVDKQDFNAPITFDVTGRIWYERKPGSYRNVHSLGYDSGSAWEGICLPFDPTKVTASKNGEISHFYGEYETGHEYWLREFKSVANAMAEFVRPATDPIVAGTPYIVAFPGNDFYEFSMEGDSDYNTSIHGRTGDGQYATFEAPSVTIPITDDMKTLSTAKDGYTHHSAFVHSTGYGIIEGSGGSKFEAGQEILPFRTYMTKSSADTRAIYIVEDGVVPGDEVLELDEPADELGEDYLRIWGEGRDIVVETSQPRKFSLYNLNGTRLGTLDCKPGQNRFTQLNGGFYLVGRTKLLLK